MILHFEDGHHAGERMVTGLRGINIDRSTNERNPACLPLQHEGEELTVMYHITTMPLTVGRHVHVFLHLPR